MSATLVYTRDDADAGVLSRRSISEAFNRAATGGKPLQPHAEGDLLIAEAYIAQDILKQLGGMLKSMLPKSDFEIGPEKDLDRAIAKTLVKGRDLAENCDFSRARHFTNINQMKKMIDLFGERGPVTISHGGKELTLHVLDVDNTFTTPNENKPGLRNLDVKLLVPFTLENGEQTYHVCELQFILNRMRKAWDISHDHACAVRQHLKRVEFLENAMEMLGTNSGSAYRRLESERDEAAVKLATAMKARAETNIRNAEKAGADELTGYQPCRKDNAENVALQQPKDYIKLVVA